MKPALFWQNKSNEKSTCAFTFVLAQKLRLYNMAGNVAEMVKEKGISKGGNWGDPGYYLHIHSHEVYEKQASRERGFRIDRKW